MFHFRSLQQIRIGLILLGHCEELWNLETKQTMTVPFFFTYSPAHYYATQGGLLALSFSKAFVASNFWKESCVGWFDLLRSNFKNCLMSQNWRLSLLILLIFLLEVKFDWIFCLIWKPLLAVFSNFYSKWATYTLEFQIFVTSPFFQNVNFYLLCFTFNGQKLTTFVFQSHNFQ